MDIADLRTQGNEIVVSALFGFLGQINRPGNWPDEEVGRISEAAYLALHKVLWRAIED